MNDLFSYVMNTPGNTNPAVLSSEILKLIDENIVQSNWEQNDSSQLDYIKNRPCYTFEEPKCTSEVVDLTSLSEGLQKIATFSSRLSSSSDLVTAWGYEKIKTSRIKNLSGCYYICRYNFRDKNGKGLGGYIYVEQRPSSIVPIDENNYYFSEFTIGSSLKVYVICDLTSLSTENKTKFSSPGFYLETPSGYTPRVSVETFPVQTMKIEQCRTLRFKKEYLPTGIQPQEIPDSNNYFETKTVEGALDQLGSQVQSNSIIIGSSTADSTKKFKITVDDTGTVTATELT